MGTVEIELIRNGDGTSGVAIHGAVLNDVQGQPRCFATANEALLAAKAAQTESEADKLLVADATSEDKRKATSLLAFSAMYKTQADEAARRPAIQKEGIAALTRLFEVAQGDSGQCRYVVRFLLGCYNGLRFPFDLTNFRCLDTALFDDCMAVLKMDAQPKQEVHTYFPEGQQKFEQLARDWSVTDVYKLMNAARDAGVDVGEKE